MVVVVIWKIEKSRYLHYVWTNFDKISHGDLTRSPRPPEQIQVALLWQRDRATRLSVEILQLQNIPIVWHYLRDPTFSGFYTIPECDRHTHRNGRTDT